MALISRSAAHDLFAIHPNIAAFVEDNVLKMLHDLASDTPIRLDEALFYGSGLGAPDDDAEPWSTDIDLLDELLLWLLGAIVLCERGELQARYRVRQQGTRRESAAIMLSVAPDEEAR